MLILNFFHTTKNDTRLKWRFIKEQEASRLLNDLGLKTPLHKIPVLGDILF